MDNELFVNEDMPPLIQFNHNLSPSMPIWHPISSPMDFQSTPSSDCFLSTPPNSDHHESVLTSMVSSSPATSNDSFIIRELIGKLGNICNSGEPPSLPPYIGGSRGGGKCGSNNTSCYSTPLNSPPKIGIGMPIIDQILKDKKFPPLGNSMSLASHLPAVPRDSGFTEPAARFPSFGSRSFNNNAEIVAYNHNVSCQMQRVWSTPSLKKDESQHENNNNSLANEGHFGQDQCELINSRENSSVSGQNPGGENVGNRKRKAVPRGKTKENKGVENGEEMNTKRSKAEDVNGDEDAKREENREEKHSNSSQKPPEPPKDYIHVRARRGQATDSHSLAERVRREKISERMKLLQDLVPGCSKVTGKALMLDEIINYVQSLQRQVEFLSMKLATVNPRLELNMGNLFSKDVIQPNCSLQHPMYPLDSLAPVLYGEHHQNPLQNSSLTTKGAMAPPQMGPLNPTHNQNHALQLPSNLIDGFANGVPQIPQLCEGDLQSIVQMGYIQKENGFQSQPLNGPNQTPLMKIEF